ncbi:hypothetical protein QRX50_36055 [Amycolatopsis carbonis]|uniref:Uncharacterized protein n=1 Tax=Amycolatopsis carbonis TaxID=715471 RepID=A0A9Y2MQ46_9PSEU|nr:hypothetical protein [Amycolatopsis sp. 2-15]WIX76810.1 hypothetical protein QRX50_36055 [Amycolatopsis sp. 2-15]
MIRWTSGEKPAGKFWRAVLLAGGATAISRWTLDPAPGGAKHAATLDDDLAAALRRPADGMALPLHPVWRVREGAVARCP